MGSASFCFFGHHKTHPTHRHIHNTQSKTTHDTRRWQVQELDGVSLKQANAIASELCTNIQFTSQLPIDHEGIDSADSTLDHVKTMVNHDRDVDRDNAQMSRHV